MMAMSQTYSICLLVLVSCFQISTQKCDCRWGHVTVEGEHVSKSVCHFKTFVVAKVKSTTTIPGPSGHDDIDGVKRFDVTITKMYTKNGVENFENGWETSVFTPMSMAHFAPIHAMSCGYIELEIGNTYYISVQDVDGSLTFNGCSFVSKNEELTDVQRKIIAGELSCP